ncbi:hypothetical protein RN607_00580 [Demequina capsici]|uniref:Uncharacterized protein n=1 Tax=Demequina capsici TaxID=3075620 RepID=A0AA96FCC3_9MICO|nr:hypothetical protein [Demequina sp. PMTSA13]WNM27528.1 hypothetical protein RN607_00580 [Demequina sp. PMTSA13]
MKLSGTLPKIDDDLERNGLAAHASDVVNHPDERRIAIVVLSTAQLIDNREKRTVDPVMAIDRIELVRPVDAHTAERLLRDALQHRTHRDTLPLFISDNIEAAFADGAVDHNTGQSYLAGGLFDEPDPSQISSDTDDPDAVINDSEGGTFSLTLVDDEDSDAPEDDQ